MESSMCFGTPFPKEKMSSFPSRLPICPCPINLTKAPLGAVRFAVSNPCVSGKYSSYKIWHFKKAHPEIPKHVYAAGKTREPIASSADLPEHARAWCCPLCKHGLPQLSTAERHRAIKRHIREFHPKETLRSSGFEKGRHLVWFIGPSVPWTWSLKRMRRQLGMLHSKHGAKTCKMFNCCQPG